MGEEGAISEEDHGTSQAEEGSKQGIWKSSPECPYLFLRLSVPDGEGVSKDYGCDRIDKGARIAWRRPFQDTVESIGF